MIIPGTIIWLNAAVGAGAGILARALTQRLGAARYFDIDMFSASGAYSGDKTPVFLNNYHMQFLDSILSYTKTGGVAVVDYIFHDHLRSLEIMGFLIDQPVYLVEVFCPLDVLEARERAYAEQRHFHARDQFYLVYGRWKVDLVVNSASTKPDDLAKVVLQHLERNTPINAFVYNLALLGSMVSQHLGLDAPSKPNYTEFSSVELSSDDLTAILAEMEDL
jgi:chloramphenicol 3-O-phosphotransferase